MKKPILLALWLALLLTALPVSAAPPFVLGWHGGGWHRGSQVRVAWGSGWGWRWRGGWGWGFGWPYYYGPPSYYGYDDPYHSRRQVWAAIDTDVSPEEARVYLDGRYIGIADDFDGYPDYLYLKRGHYRLEFKLDGYETKTVEIDARPGTKLDINDKLAKIPGAKHRGSYETPTPEGGVQRFFGKRPASGQTVPGQDTTPGYSSGPTNPDRPEGAEEGEERPEASPADPWRTREDSTPHPQAGVSEEHPAKSRLRLRVEPVDAAVYVDDHFVGTAEEVGSLERGVAVSPGKHTVTVSRPGFKDRSVDVEVGAGESQPLEITLER